ncbi:MAG: hypothetical protein GC190_20920 [Alphaproteobacteria bacterium]|nr:hypothetical protein [Alphaproteobacteria bacterium]
MTRAFIGAALAVALLGSVSAYAGDATTPAATDTPPTPPASLHCKAPKVATQVTDKHGKTSWKCVKPAPTTAPATPQ